jgi:BlaI family penicillinase repressor
MKELTKAEEQIMQILWKLEKGLVNDLLDQLPEPKPAYNTVSTIIRILEKKGFVDHKAYGKTYEYFPLIDKETYANTFVNGVLKRYFSSSFSELASFFTVKNKMSISELEEIKKLIDEELVTRKKD